MQPLSLSLSLSLSPSLSLRLRDFSLYFAYRFLSFYFAYILHTRTSLSFSHTHTHFFFRLVLSFFSLIRTDTLSLLFASGLSYTQTCTSFLFASGLSIAQTCASFLFASSLFQSLFVFLSLSLLFATGARKGISYGDSLSGLHLVWVCVMTCSCGVQELRACFEKYGVVISTNVPQSHEYYRCIYRVALRTRILRAQSRLRVRLCVRLAAVCDAGRGFDVADRGKPGKYGFCVFGPGVDRERVLAATVYLRSTHQVLLFSYYRFCFVHSPSIFVLVCDMSSRLSV